MVTIYALYLSFGSGNYISGFEIHFDPKGYVGCTAGKLSKRLREHRCLLRSGKHKCMSLQADFTLHPEAVLSIEPLEFVLTDIRREREIHWMNQLLSMNRLYNEHLISFEPPEGASAKAAAARVANGYRPSAESNQKRRLAQLGKPKGHGAKISATKRAKAMR